MRTWTVHRRITAVLLLLATAAGCDGGAEEAAAGERAAGERSAATGEPAAEPTGDAAGAEAAIASLFAAMNARDPDRLLAHYHGGGELVQVACTEVRHGYGRVEPLIRMWQEDESETRIEHQVVRSLALGDDGAVVAARGRNQQGLALFWTFVLRRDERGAWRVVQEHQSWPDCREPRIHPMTTE